MNKIDNKIIAPTDKLTLSKSRNQLTKTIKNLEQKKADIEEQIKDPDTMTMGMKSFMPAIKGLALGGLLMAGSAMVSGISEPMKPLDIPIPPLPHDMLMPGISPIVYRPHEDNSRSPYIDKLINFMENTGNTILSSGFEGLSESSRKEDGIKNLHKIRKKYDTEIKQNQIELNKLTAANGLNTIIAGKENFQYPAIKNVTSFDDFATQINDVINKNDSDVAKLYTEFSDAHKDLDKDDKKEVFMNTLFDNVLDVEFRKSFDEMKKEDDELNNTFDKPEENESQYDFKNDDYYKNIVFGNTNPQEGLKNIDIAVREKFNSHVGNNSKTFDILLKAITSDNSDDKTLASNFMREYIAYKHKQNLEEKNSALFKLIKDRFK